MVLETPAQILQHEASQDAVRGFVDWRKLTKKPLTERAALLIAKSLREITGAGGDADEALDLTQEHGWQTVKPDWYWRIKNGNGNHNNGSQQKATRADTASRGIAIAATARRSPQGDCF